ncbi:MAG: HD domain-containing protein [Cyclobacteriaceae bacterium]
MSSNKRKIINDPVYGFISIPSDLIFEIIQHPFFQRMRRIKQLGLTELVYPGAIHTRFHHALGSLHLMKSALDTLRAKGHFIYDTEYEATLIAILLHDIGHGPFSHTLESTLLKGVRHEELSIEIIKELNRQFQGKLDFALQVFQNKYPRKFLNQLVSSQLDIDRLDYLRRDSFFTGVQEGTIGSERIIKMMNIVDDELVIEEKGIYSIENFLNARRLMYWQVYLHKTTVCAEKMLIKVIERARYLCKNNELTIDNSLQIFLDKDFRLNDFTSIELLNQYCSLDDFDIWSALKKWSACKDKVLSRLCNALLNRNLFKTTFLKDSIPQADLNQLKKMIASKFSLDESETTFMIASGSVSNSAYLAEGHIKILTKGGSVVDITDATDLPNIQAMQKNVRKYFICWPPEINFNFLSVQ